MSYGLRLQLSLRSEGAVTPGEPDPYNLTFEAGNVLWTQNT